MITYVHKETGMRFTREYLKECLEAKPNNTLYISNSRAVFHLGENSIPVTYEYRIKDIPFSDEFEVEHSQNTFSIEELDLTIHAIQMLPVRNKTTEDLRTKFINMFEIKRKEDFENKRGGLF